MLTIAEPIDAAVAVRNGMFIGEALATANDEPRQNGNAVKHQQ